MAKVIVVTSGKGGVGKTTTTAALGAALAQTGQKVAVVDFDVGLRNLDLVMGAERRVVFDIVNVIQGVAKLSQALIRDKRIETLWLLYAHHVKVPPGGTQWIETRRAFFGGATTLFETIMRVLEPDAEPTEKDLARMDRIAKELARWGDEMKAGTA